MGTGGVMGRAGSREAATGGNEGGGEVALEGEWMRFRSGSGGEGEAEEG